MIFKDEWSVLNDPRTLCKRAALRVSEIIIFFFEIQRKEKKVHLWVGMSLFFGEESLFFFVKGKLVFYWWSETRLVGRKPSVNLVILAN